MCSRQALFRQSGLRQTAQGSTGKTGEELKSTLTAERLQIFSAATQCKNNEGESHDINTALHIEC